MVTATYPRSGASAGLSARDGRYAAGVRTTLSDVGATVCEFFRAPRHKMVALFFPPSGLQETPYGFDPTGYTLAHEHLHIDLSGLKTTWTAALISMRSFARR